MMSFQICLDFNWLNSPIADIVLSLCGGIPVFVPVPPIRHRCNRVQCPPWGHLHRVKPLHTFVVEGDHCAHHVDEQKSQRRSSDHHLLRCGGEHRQGQRPLLQVSAQRRAAALTCCWFTGSGSDCTGFSSFISLHHTATAPPTCRHLRPWMML